ncbi:hypothetical protein BKA66DRAFT_467919 [Pyrenochaeta sp. MPI-SDFR-AT-0127]|nr:hypothetical protein BKA66DRAFT_467919 [Pyrenochaeta sp. MPI-SDFR-AT-0127]
MFSSKHLPVFRPLTPPLPHRKPCGEACNPQIQSPFLSQLPPEVRNEIYYYVFTGAAQEVNNAKSHPLSLLLTCHKINHEAVNLAFHTFTFPVAPNFKSSYLALRNKTLHLSAEQTSAITALSYDRGNEYISSVGDVPNVLTNAILLLPTLKRFEIHIRKGHKSQQEAHHSPLLVGHTFRDPSRDAVEKYAPTWFDYKTLRAIASGQAYSWQEGQKWRVEWPQLASSFFHCIDGRDMYGERCWTPYMGSEAVNSVRGVHMCVCGCGEVCWLSADLIQETGRRICVDTQFYGTYKRTKSFEEQLANHKIRLLPGVKPLPVTEGPSGGNVGVTSIAHDADQEYWDGIRRRNWKLDALWRGCWKRVRSKDGGVNEDGSMSAE